MAHAYNFIDLTGQKIHRLTFLEYAGVNENRNFRQERTDEILRMHQD